MIVYGIHMRHAESLDMVLEASHVAVRAGGVA